MLQRPTRSRPPWRCGPRSCRACRRPARWCTPPRASATRPPGRPSPSSRIRGPVPVVDLEAGYDRGDAVRSAWRVNDDPTVLRLERVFDAPPERVYAAWTEPALLRRWWAAEPGWTTPEATTDVRVGGAYRLSMKGTDGILRTVVGEYLEIDPPRRLVYTWKWVEHAAPPPSDGVTVV